MRIGFCDFVPNRVQTGVFSVEEETLGHAVARANDWIAAGNIDVINVETVMIPGRRGASEDGEQRQFDSTPDWVYVVRVWFREPS